MTARAQVLAQLADLVLGVRLPHPTRVAIDGRSAAGKTTLADELEELIRAEGREVLRPSFDDFHRPGHAQRSKRLEWTPQTLYDEGYDYDAFRDLLLAPLGPGGDRRCRLGILDAASDSAWPEEWHEASADAVVLVDGAFLLRTELAAHWDLTIWVDIDWDTMLARARRRDVAWVGSEELVELRYRRGWLPAHELYEAECRPAERARVVLDNTHVEAPRLLERRR